MHLYWLQQGLQLFKLFDRFLKDVIIHRDVQFHETLKPPNSYKPHVAFNLHVVTPSIDIETHDAHINEEFIVLVSTSSSIGMSESSQVYNIT
jgi:hypothetical protein